jgi:hypothetical protein
MENTPDVLIAGSEARTAASAEEILRINVQMTGPYRTANLRLAYEVDELRAQR